MKLRALPRLLDMFAKILQEIPEARVFRISDEYLYYEIMFSLEHIHQVCELAKARSSRRGKRVSEEKRKSLLQVGFGIVKRRRPTIQRTRNTL